MAKEANSNAVESMIESSIGKDAVIAVNIKYAKNALDGKPAKRKSLPESFVLDLPERITQLPDKTDQKYLDMIETFVYNTLTKKFQTEVTGCQIWIQ